MTSIETGPMRGDSEKLPRADRLILLGIAAAVALVHLLTNGR